MSSKNSTQQREIEYRRQCVKDAWIKLGVFGVTQQQIVEALTTDYKITVDQATISRDLAAIKKAMQERTPDDLKAYLMAEYEYIIGEARQGWNRSVQDAVTETSEVIEVPEVGKDAKGNAIQTTSQRLKASTRKVGQAGDSSFLAEIRQTAKSIREMFGVDPKEAGSSENKPFYMAQIKEIAFNLEPFDKFKTQPVDNSE